jgi:hypothetical protein
MRNKSKIDRVGVRYGRLLVTGPAHKSGYQQYWFCRCDCGIEKAVQGGNLVSGHVQSCGCLVKERMAEQNKIHGQSRSRDGRPTLTYNSWHSMKQRCRDPNHDNWDEYGGRGITVCDRWLNSFENFLTDMGERPSSAYTLDRIKGSEGYEPGNVRWATAKEQQQNLRSNRIISFNGVAMNVTDAALAAGLPRNAVFKRLEAGWTEQRALTEPLQRSRPA